MKPETKMTPEEEKFYALPEWQREFIIDHLQNTVASQQHKNAGLPPRIRIVVRSKTEIAAHLLWEENQDQNEVTPRALFVVFERRQLKSYPNISEYVIKEVGL